MDNQIDLLSTGLADRYRIERPHIMRCRINAIRGTVETLAVTGT